MAPERKERRGFASMSPERQREIASKGGRAAHAKGTAHAWTPEEGRAAGRTRGRGGAAGSGGGRGARAKGTAHEWTPEEARSAGRKGGQVSRGGRGRLPSEPVGLE